MKLLVTLFFCWVIILVSGADQPLNNSTEKNASKVNFPPEPTPAEPTSTTKPPTPAPNTNITTSTTTVSPSPSNITTQATNITTVAPITTTLASTTGATPASSTPSTPTPGPAPAPKTGQWVVNGINSTCIILRMAAQFNVTYITNDNKTMSRQITLPSSNSTTATGTCGDIEQIITISWISSMAPMTDNDSLTLHFIKNTTLLKYSLHHVEVSFAAQELPKFNSSVPLMLIHNASVYQIPLINSYRCLKLQKISLMSNMTNITTSFLEVSDLQFQAFKNEKSSAFSVAEDCPFETPDYIPIAIGCGLIILVIVVLVAYIVGRRRSQSRGYLSM